MQVSLLFLCSARPKPQDGIVANGEASNSKQKYTTIDDVLKGLVEWLCAQVFFHFQLSLVYNAAGT